MNSTTEKVIAILQRTSDGNRLSPEDLNLTQQAINDGLTERGLTVFEDLYQRVNEGRYERPWLYGIEHLTREHGGYIKWRGKTVEHYSFRDSEAEREAAEKLAANCRALEAKGFPVNWNTMAPGFTPFHDAPAGTPWVEAMSSYYTAFANSEGRCQWLILVLPGHHAVALWGVHGEIVMQYGIAGRDFGSYVLFHKLQDQGFVCIAERLRSYAGFVQCMAEAGITPEAVRRVLSADHSSVLPQAA